MTPADDGETPKDSLAQIGQEVRDSYTRNKRVMSFDEFFRSSSHDPEQYARNAAQYLKDVFDHFGTEEVKTPRGDARRAGSSSTRRSTAGRDRLVGPGGGADARLPRDLATSCARARQQAGPPARAERLGQVDLRRAAWCARSSTTRRSTRARSIASTGSSRRRSCRRAASASAAASARAATEPRRDTSRTSTTTWSTRKLVDELRDNPLLLVPPKRRQQILDEKLRGKSAFTPVGLHSLRRSRPQEQADLRGAAGRLQGRLPEGAAPRAGRALLRLAALPAGAVTVEPQLAVDAQCAAADDGPLAQRAADGAAVALALRVLRASWSTPTAASSSIAICSSGRSRPTSTCSAPSSTPRSRCRHTIVFLDAFFIGSSNEIAPGRVQGDPRVPVVQGAARAGARALPARLRARGADLRRADPRRRRSASTSRRTPRSSRRCGRCSRACASRCRRSTPRGSPIWSPS